MKTRNEIFAKGKIENIFQKKTGASVLIVRSFSRRPVYLKFVVPAGTKTEDYSKNDVVEINGYVRAYSMNDGTKWSTFQYSVVDSLRKESPACTKDLNNTKFHCSYDIEGTLVGYVNEPDGWTRLTVRVDEDNHGRKTSYVHLSMYRPDVANELRKDSVIKATCNIETPMKTIRGEKTHYQDYIVDSVNIVDAKAA